MVSLTIISVVYAVGSFSVKQYRTQIRSGAEIHNLANVLREARNKAISELNNVIILFDQDTDGQYTGIYSVCDDDNANSTCDPEEQTKDYELAPEVFFAVSTTAAGLPSRFRILFVK